MVGRKQLSRASKSGCGHAGQRTSIDPEEHGILRGLAPALKVVEEKVRILAVEVAAPRFNLVAVAPAIVSLVTELLLGVGGVPEHGEVGIWIESVLQLGKYGSLMVMLGCMDRGQARRCKQCSSSSWNRKLRHPVHDDALVQGRQVVLRLAV